MYGQLPIALQSGESGHVMVILDPDVANVFTTSATVNAVLRALITTMPKTPQV